jgi:hypothetical protein
VEDPALVARPCVAHTHEGRHSSHATMGQKLKGSMTQFMGALTRNEAKKERGRLLKQGVDPSSTTASTTHVYHQTSGQMY